MSYKNFEEFPPDMQKTLIDWCIKERILFTTYEGYTIHLPNLLQITYFCKKCGISYPIQIYSADLIRGQISPNKKCADCKKEMYISHKTIPLDYTLISGKKKEKNNLNTFLKTST